MYILSTNKKKQILSIAEQTLGNEYNIFHYLMTNCNISKLLEGIESKVKELTINDFCVILIGEEC